MMLMLIFFEAMLMLIYVQQVCDYQKQLNEIIVEKNTIKYTLVRSIFLSALYSDCSNADQSIQESDLWVEVNMHA